MLLLTAALIVSAVTLIPLGYVVLSASQQAPAEAYDFLVRPRVEDLLTNTIKLVLGGVTLSAVFGVGAAWVVERTDLPWRGLWHGVLAAPLAVPAFVNGYGWVSLTHGVQSYWGAVLVVSLSYYPLVYLPTVAALRRLDPGLEEVASLTRSRRSVFWLVVLPTISPAVLGGCLLVGLHLLGEYGALQLLNYPTLTTGILDQYRATFNGPAAGLLAAVLAGLCLLLLLIEMLARGRRPRYRVGSGAQRGLVRRPLGRALPLYLGGLVAFAALTLGVPLGSLVHWLAHGTSTTLPAGDLSSAAVTTAVLAILGGVATTAAAIPGAWLAVRHHGLVSTLIERSSYTASALPGIVVALALVTVSIRLVPSLYQTLLVLIVGYAIMFLPRAMVSVRSTLELAPPALEDVARSLGYSRLGAARRVTLPLTLPGLGASLALVSLAVSTELTATLLLAPTGVTTLSTEFWARASAVEYGAAAPYALMLVLLSVPATWILSRLATGTLP